ncbi:MAG: sugar ABC transporter permease, partial [Actinomycetia bacterium]|nr:sugar ABC transporter permease [Actinomycetes bacterium]
MGTSQVALAAPGTVFDGSSVGGGAQAPSPTARRAHKPGTSGWRANLEIGLLSGPAIIIFLAFVIVPVFVALYYSFYNWQGWGPARPDQFVGWKNYVWTLTNKAFWQAVGHNGIIMVLGLIMQGPLAVLVALLLNQKMRGRSLIRVLVFVPYVISEAIAGIGFFLMLQDNGAVNVLFGTKISWLADPKVAIWTLMFILT